MKEIFIIVPFFNENSQVLRKTIMDLLVHFENLVLINDGGCKNAWKEMSDLPVFYLRHPVNLGQGAALQTGMEFALGRGANILVHFDADGQHDPGDALRMIHLLNTEKLDIVLGSRFLERKHAVSVPFTRRLLIKTGIFINFLFSGLWMTDAHHGLRVIHRRMATKINFKENRQLHATEILTIIKKNKFSYKEYPAKVSYSPYSIDKGQKNIHFIKIFKDLVLSRFIK